MNFSFPPVDGPGPTSHPAAAPRTGSAKGADGAEFARRIAAADAGPPPELEAEVQEAARAASRLHELGRELRFEHDASSGRMQIEVRDLAGNVLRRVPPAEVFDFAQGKVTS